MWVYLRYHHSEDESKLRKITSWCKVGTKENIFCMNSEICFRKCFTFYNFLQKFYLINEVKFCKATATAIGTGTRNRDWPFYIVFALVPIEFSCPLNENFCNLVYVLHPMCPSDLTPFWVQIHNKTINSIFNILSINNHSLQIR